MLLLQVSPRERADRLGLAWCRTGGCCRVLRTGCCLLIRLGRCEVGCQEGRDMAASPYQPSLHLYVVWNPDSHDGPDASAGAQIAERIYSHFCRDVAEPISRGLGIPVFYRTAPTLPINL